MFKIKFITGWVFLCCLSYQAWGQFPFAQHFTTEDGLPSSLVYWCTEDKDGHLWFVTDRGVSRFDGYQFKRFTRADGLTNNDIWGVESGKDGVLWFSTFNQPIYFENNRFKTPVIPKNLKFSKIENYRFDKNELVYFKDFKDQFFIKKGKDNNLEISQMESPFFLFNDSADNSWYYNLAFRGKIEIFRESDKINPAFELDLTGNEVNYSIFFEQQIKDKIIFSSKKSFIEFDLKGLKIREWNEIFGEDLHVTALYKFNENWLFLNTSKGYFILDENLNIVEGYDFLNNYNLNYAFQDNRKNTWLCTSDDGVYFVTAAAFNSKTYNVNHSNGSNDLLKLSYDKTNGLVAGAWDGALFYLKDNGLEKINLSLPVGNSKRVLGLAFTNDGTLWLGGDFGWSGLPDPDLKSGIFNLSTGQRFRTDDLLPNQLYNIYTKETALSENYIYIGHRKGTSRFMVENNLLAQTLIEENTSPAYALAATDTSVWIGKKEGIFYWSEKENKTIFKGDESPIFKLPVNSLVIDKEDNLWIGSDGFGVFRYSLTGETDTIFELKNTIPKSLFFDSQKSDIWVAHNGGVSRIRVTGQSPFSYSYHLLDGSHGLASEEVNDVVINENDIFVATKKGLTVLDYETVFSQKNDGKLHISNIKINGNPKEIADKFELKSHENNIIISFVCISYKNVKKIIYSYKMEGFDTDWQRTSDLKKEYTFLPSGKYIFKIKATDSDGFTTSEKEIQFNIETIWYKRKWAYLSYVLSGFLILQFLYNRRIKAINAKNQAQNEVNKKIAELELEALQTQMNPHFIFNAMQAIQNFVLQNDARTANKYMVRFSKLMRLFLESSKQKYITVSEEIQLLTFYVELEHLRFTDNFDYRFEIAPGLEQSTEKMASMLIQPFVENAINHGLVQSKTKGDLLIKLIKSGDFLDITIDDDGIGREEGKRLRQESFKHHKSRGMQLIDERKKVFNTLNDRKILIKIIDKKNKNGEAIGTKIEMRLPLSK